MASLNSWYKEKICLASHAATGVTIYLVDSGIDTTHAEFRDATIHNLHTYDESFVDTLGHGTGIASIIVGKTLGIAPDVKLMNVKIDVRRPMNEDQVIDAFTAILAEHHGSPAVVNCSWTMPKSQRLDDTIMALHHAGLLIVAAAGNELRPADGWRPVSSEHVLGVGASDPNNELVSWAPGRGSNWGPEVDIIAPGIGVEVAVLGGETAPAAGTSIATAIVSSIAAQFIAKHPDKTAQEIHDMILANALPNVLVKDDVVYHTTPNLFIQPYMD